MFKGIKTAFERRKALKDFSEGLLTKVKASRRSVRGVTNTGRSGAEKMPRGINFTGRGIKFDYRTLRHDSRRAYHQSLGARAIIDRISSKVAGCGLRFESTPSSAILGMTQEEADVFARDVEHRFDLWASSRLQDRANKMNWYQTHHLWQMMKDRDGGAFSRYFYESDPELLNPLQFQLLDANQIVGDDYLITTQGPHVTRDGIERDERGRAVAYRVRVPDYSGNSQQKTHRIPAKTSDGGRLLMVHGYNHEYAGQNRGFPKLAHALQDFQNLTNFTQAALMKAINQASIIMGVENDVQDPTNIVDDYLSDKGLAPVGDAYGKEIPNTTVSPTGDAEDIYTYTKLPEFTVDQPGSGIVMNMSEGDKLKFYESKASADSFEAFTGTFFDILGAAHHVPGEVLKERFGTNYSASRAALLMFHDFALWQRSNMEAEYCNPTYESWFLGEVAAGRIIAPGIQDPIKRAAYLKGRWVGSPMPVIEPVRAAKAAAQNIKNGSQTLDHAARELNGSTWDSNKVGLAREVAEHSAIFGEGALNG